MSTATALTTKATKELTTTTIGTEVSTAKATPTAFTEKPATTAITTEVSKEKATAAKTIEELTTTATATEVSTETAVRTTTDKVQTVILTTEKLTTTETITTPNTEKSEKSTVTAVTTKKPVVMSVATALRQNIIKPTEKSGATITSHIFTTGVTTTEKRNPTPRSKATTKPEVIQITTTDNNTNGKVVKPWTSQGTTATENTGSQNLQRITKITKHSTNTYTPTLTTVVVDNTISGNNACFS